MRFIALLCALVISACSTAPVKPWERGDLSRTIMDWQPDPMEAALRDHIYISKEAAAGGIGTGGGGCGCY